MTVTKEEICLGSQQGFDIIGRQIRGQSIITTFQRATNKANTTLFNNRCQISRQILDMNTQVTVISWHQVPINYLTSNTFSMWATFLPKYNDN